MFCPDCQSRAGTIALEGGPTLIRHKSDRHRCTREWVVVPDSETGVVAQIKVDGREQADKVLRSAVRSYLAHQFRDFMVDRFLLGEAPARQPVGLMVAS